MKLHLSVILAALLAAACSKTTAVEQSPPPPTSESSTVENPCASDDDRVQSYLLAKKDTWRDANVPYEDGKVLHDLIVERKARNILEIGTSTGHSTIWLAWAAKKIGGHVTTIEIDPSRHRQAVDNIRAAGLSEFVHFHLADAHQLVKTLPGPFDFVFSDADKDWYVNYFNDVDPKINPGGCIAAHNALNGFAGVDRYIEHVRARADYVTTIERSSPSGFAISCKKTP
ncbi:MAG: class I SAM-dependent methyltransferase [Myxococcota bacterium]